ncbi:MAG: hypothetical protein ACJ73Z_04610 [Rubrobacteraceae bacterium]
MPRTPAGGLAYRKVGLRAASPPEVLERPFEAPDECYYPVVSESGTHLARRRHFDGLQQTALFAIWLLLVDVSPQQDVYANPDYGLSLLAALGTAGCVGYLLTAIFRLYRAPFGSQGVLSRSSSVEAFTSDSRHGGENWPLLVALLFGSFLVLFSGLGGWVDAYPRVTRPALPA